MQVAWCAFSVPLTWPHSIERYWKVCAGKPDCTENKMIWMVHLHFPAVGFSYSDTLVVFNVHLHRLHLHIVTFSTDDQSVVNHLVWWWIKKNTVLSYEYLRAKRAQVPIWWFWVKSSFSIFLGPQKIFIFPKIYFEGIHGAVTWNSPISPRFSCTLAPFSQILNHMRLDNGIPSLPKTY